MKKSFCAIIPSLLKIGLLSYIILLFAFIAIKGNVETSYAKNLNSLQALDSSSATTPTSSSTPTSAATSTPTTTATSTPTTTATSTPTTTATSTPTTTATSTPTTTATSTPTTTATSTPTTTATSTPTTTATRTPTPAVHPTPAPTQVPQVVPPPQVNPIPPAIDPMTTAIPATATPVSTPQSTTPTTVVVTPTSAKTSVPIPVPPHLQKTGGNGINAFTLSLALGLAAPSLMIGGGTLWLLIRWLIKKQRLTRERETQASPWVSSAGMQASFQALQSVSGAALNATMPSTSTSGAAPISTPAAQPTYTASNLRPITLALPQQMLTMHSSGVAHYPLNSDLQPLPINSTDLSLEVTRAVESNGNGHMPLLPDTLTGLADTPTSSMPSSPPLSTIQPPAVKDDSMLASMMRQAQIGLFALPGREKSLVS